MFFSVLFRSSPTTWYSMTLLGKGLLGMCVCFRFHAIYFQQGDSQHPFGAIRSTHQPGSVTQEQINQKHRKIIPLHLAPCSAFPFNYPRWVHRFPHTMSGKCAPHVPHLCRRSSSTTLTQAKTYSSENVLNQKCTQPKTYSTKNVFKQRCHPSEKNKLDDTVPHLSHEPLGLLESRRPPRPRRALPARRGLRRRRPRTQAPLSRLRRLGEGVERVGHEQSVCTAAGLFFVGGRAARVCIAGGWAYR